ncbi:pirin family protein [Cerasicoccus fimbriatus]|uniref:pirin family protein n=1 Tax=Cerasicoccus fimbriatus TaxID=3014554 RepID=UPI0022B4DB93|nr:pirin family protein [Cerasicoccus sp. TK19100]
MQHTSSNTHIRRSQQRGHADHGWLKSWHTFSFASYYDPAFMGFRSLRVINQDIVAPGGGFPTHPHRDMEIFSYVLQGEMAHKDSMGNERTLRPGDVQLMSAGTGITHSEFNPSSENPLHLLQIWIQPAQRGLTPSYSDWESRRDAAKSLLISPDGREDSAVIHQDAYVYRVKLAAGESLSHEVAPGRGAWFQLISGQAQLGDATLNPGDAFATEASGALTITANEAIEGLLFDLK